jgi:hypothetical protein
MATSGPITYLVMADQFPSVAVHEAPAPEYRMPGPPTGITRGASMLGSYIGLVAVCGAHRSAAA